MNSHPRENLDNLGTIAYKSEHYIGEEIIEDPVDWIANKLGYNHGIQAFNALIHNIDLPYSNEFLTFLMEKFDNIAIHLPVYLYNHSGITVSTSPFSCRWDSGQVGIIYVLKEKVYEEYNVRNISSKIKESVTKILENEILELDKYLTGDYG